jgi:hypothetical protein
MKLAEALILRADHQKRLAQLRTRLLANARVQEGENPAEDPQSLLAEYTQVAGELRTLVQQVNITNSSTLLQPGQTIADAIARRDELQLLHAINRDLAQAAMARQDRLTKSGFSAPVPRRRLGQRASRTRCGHPGTQLVSGSEGKLGVASW